jgi:hypothetical protein
LPENILDLFLQNTSKKHKFKPLGIILWGCFFTYCIKFVLHTLGIPDVYIMQRGGWEDDTTLKNVYRHVLVDREKEMNEIGNDYFSKLCNTECNTKKESAEK